ncbi:hypothetical protein ODA53_000022 [Salmonella enterica]|uniref:Ead/Ea22-like family protein n=6 Tax=Salmonella enterica I TaxID=59201 RepID=A0A5W1HJR2_SALET|nr:hypothetical protein [Salmonella enterica]EAA9136723.1 hypothetical protein [Salmonella enterica subsp. enterica serovar Mbandaka]EAM2365378.1 hypothetical protein [Salmonella enterica subsp. enterica serovar 4,[5],12:i:-]EBT0647529.1 hypothetical protein [Salmonella enterica subsp. enterica serovar Uganda]EBW2564735.1 hypothetical protein [Salmonella enterica subsp. enterica serovar Chester]EBZ1435474.1 hypothetical protein [Salmonella enterica subsp. enterica serovar Montevideo]ECQ397553
MANNQLSEWRMALNKAVENYQSAHAWYEENQSSLSVMQDVEEAEGVIEKLIRQHGVLIVLNLLDEIDELKELQEYRKARIVPDGWVAVPAEPTGDMLARIKLSKVWTTEALTARYKDMLRAAPRAPYMEINK